MFIDNLSFSLNVSQYSMHENIEDCVSLQTFVYIDTIVFAFLSHPDFQPHQIIDCSSVVVKMLVIKHIA